MTQECGAGYVRNPHNWEALREESSNVLHKDLSELLDVGVDATAPWHHGKTVARKVRKAVWWLMTRLGIDTSKAESQNMASNEQILRAVGRYITEQRKDRPCDYRKDREGRKRYWCPPVHHQKSANTCSSHVVSSLLEFLERKDLRARAKPGEWDEEEMREAMGGASRLFLHQVATMIGTRGRAIDPTTRGLKADKVQDGRAISDILKVLLRYGVPPEDFWPYPGDAAGGPALEAQPTAFVFNVAADFKAEQLIRIDHPDDLPGLVPGDAQDPEREEQELLLLLMKASLLLYGLPLTAGLLGYPRKIAGKPIYATSDEGEVAWPAQEGHRGEIPLPDTTADEVAKTNGHAVLIVGFDESKEIVHPRNPLIKSTGAFLFQNSWGKDWGDEGYGWLPYDYVLGKHVDDIWSLSHATFSNLGKVERSRFMVGELTEQGDVTSEELEELRSYFNAS